jgi:hypothetical protein
MGRFLYQSGDEVKPGDRIRYHGEPGGIEFVITEATGDPSRDWFLDEFPEGGVMLRATGFGSVFVTDTDREEDLELIARSDSPVT